MAGSYDTSRRNAHWLSYHTLLHLLALSLCIGLVESNISGSGSASGLINPISAVSLTVNDGPILNIMWNDSSSGFYTNGYVLNITATVNSVVIYEDSVTTNISSSENEHSIDPAPFAQSGATIDVTVQARVMDSLCDPMFASLTISGDFSPSPEQFVISTPSPTSLNLSWTVPFHQVVPDSFTVSYTTIRLSGIQPSPNSDTFTIAYDNDTSLRETDGMYSYLLDEGLTAHTDFSFSLSSTYGTAMSKQVNATATTSEDTSGPVTDLSANITTTDGLSFDISVAWSAPTEPNGVTLRYTYTITATDEVIESQNTTDTSVEISSLNGIEPFTDYNVSVFAVNSAGDGETTTIRKRSPETAPGPVGGLVASFEETGAIFDPSLMMLTLDVIISWDEPAERNGVITAYSVTVFKTGNSSDEVYSNDSIHLTDLSESVMVLPFTNYTVSVAASTSAGQGEESTYTIISPEAVPGKVANLNASFISMGSVFDTTSRMYTLDVEIVWEVPTYQNGLILSYEVNITQEVSGVVVYTNASLEVPNVTVSVMVLPFTNYTVSVAASTQAGQGEESTFTIESPQAVPGEVEDLMLVFATTGSMFNSISRMHTVDMDITWRKPTYPNGVITAYNVTVYRSDDPTDVVYNNNSIQVPNVSESVMVLAFTVYTVTVTASTSAGEGEGASDTDTSPEAVPSEVRDLDADFDETGAVFSITSRMYTLDIDIDWIEPMYPNGDITGYDVTVYQTDNSTDVVYDDNVADPNVTAMSVMVLPFTYYTVSVTASTSAGQGEESLFIDKSPEAVPGAVENLNASFGPSINFSSTTRLHTLNVNIMWDEPIYPNGEIESYEVTVVQTDNPSNDVYSNNVTDLSVTESVMVLPFTNYTVSVAASTSAGQGEESTFTIESPQAAPSQVVGLVASFAPFDGADTMFDPDTQMYTLPLDITWSEPTYPNGQITTYEVNVYQSDNTSNNIHSATPTTPDVTAVVTVMPFTSYTVAVTASTLGGEGDESTFVTRSPEAVPSQVRNLNADFITTGAMFDSNMYTLSINISWEEPAYLNGDITSYEVIVARTDDDDDLVFTNSNVTVLNIIAESVVLLPFTSYTVSVAASTLAGQGESESLVRLSPEAAPSAPSDVSVVALTSESVRVSWSVPDPANGEITGYRVTYFPTSIGMDANQTLMVGESMTSRDITGLTPFTNYTVYVEGVTIAVGEKSADVSVMTLEDAPVAPMNVTATAVNSTAITVQWDEPAPANGIIRGYNISYNITDSQMMVINEMASAGAVTVGDLMPFTFYQFTVTAFTIESGPGESDTARTDQAAPTAPQNPTVVEVTAFSVYLQWEQPEPANGIIMYYIIRYYRVSTPSVFESRNVSGQETSVNVTGLQAAMRYTFRVSAVTVAKGMFSEINATTAESTPSAPLNVAARNDSSTAIIVEWSPPAIPRGDIISYTVSYYLTDLGEPNISTTVTNSGSMNRTRVSGLMKYMEYTVFVQASTMIGVGDRSETANVFTDEDVPSAPLGARLDATGPTSMTANWSTPASPNGIILHYNLILGREGDNGFELADTQQVNAINGVDSYSFTFTNLSAFMLYEVVITAETRIGPGPPATDFETTDPDSASPPSFVTATPLTSTSIELSWGYPTIPRGNITSYIILFSNGTFSFTPEEELNLLLLPVNDMQNQSYNFSDLAPYTLYQFSVQAVAVTDERPHFGIPSQPQQVRTLQDIPSRPLDFTLASVQNEPNTLSATWLKPDPANGIITGYTLTCTLSPQQYYNEQSSSEPSSVTVIVSGGETQTAVTGLQPFTNYTCSMTANTSVGEGPPSATLSERTVEDEPSAPREFMLDADSSTQLSASWERPIPANGVITDYTLYCEGSNSQFYPDQIRPALLTRTVNGSTTSITVPGLLPFTNYDCSVSATTSAGEGTKSTTRTQRTDEDVPLDRPRSFVASAVNSTSIELSWVRPATPNGEITTYVIFYAAVDSNESINTIDTMFTVQGLNEYTDYTFTVSAATRVGVGPAAEDSERTLEDAPNAAVTELDGVNTSSTSLSISWQPPPPLDQNGIIREYNVFYGLSTQDRSGYVNVSTAAQSKELVMLEKFRIYTVYVRAFTVGPGPEASVNVSTDSDLPSEPLNLSYANITADSIKVCWSQPAEPNGIISSYRLRYVEEGTGRVEVMEGILPGREEDGFLVDQLMEYHVYNVSIAASTDKGFGNYSLPLTVLTDEHAPDAPQNFTVEVVNSTSVLATWDPPSDSNGIILNFLLTIELTNDYEYLPPPAMSDFPDLDPNQFALEITGLHPFARYELKLRAATSAGPGNFTAGFVMTTSAVPAQGVQNTTATVTSATQTKLTWKPPDLENWNGILTNYTIDITAVEDCENRVPVPNFPGSPITEVLNQSEFKTPANPTHANESGGLQLESLTVDNLQEYQDYLFEITVWNTEGSASDHVASVCVRTQEAAPSGPPSIESFLIMSSMSAVLQWQPPDPLEQNGVIRDYRIRLCSSRTVECEDYSTGNSGTSYEFEDLVPFTNYTVSVAALTIGDPGPFSDSRTDMTFQDLPSEPSGLEVDDKDHDFISLSWGPPDTPNGIVEMYRIIYQPYKDESLINKTTCDISDGITVTTSMTSIDLTGLIGDSQYCIHIAARTGAGYGENSTIVVDLPIGPPPVDVIDPERDPLVVPRPVRDPDTGDDGITDTSAEIMFTLPTEINMNGPVDRVLFYVRRLPSTNEKIGTWYESSQASSNWPQYAAVSMTITTQQRAKRDAGGIPVSARIGDDSASCGRSDTVCNGPLESDAEYGVRYTLFSGTQSQDYPFFDDAVFRTDKAPAEPSASIAAIAGGVVGGLIAVAVICAIVVLAVYLLRLRKKGSIDISTGTKHGSKPLLPRKNGNANSRKPAPFLGPSDPGIVPLGEIKNSAFSKSSRSSTKSNSRRIMLKELGDTVRQMLDDTGIVFSEEYERVTEVGLDHGKEASLMTENRAKNRYTNILAYDHSRVKLSYVDDDPGSDYINASYIPGYRMRRAYIATQGPLPATFDDFWRMVWEQNTHTIVMLTQLVERGRTKCHRYWPGAECIVYGEIAVEMLSEKEKEDWTVREFKLTIEKKTRTVWQYQFTSWPDHGVPDTPTAALDFVKTVRESVLMNHGPLVVHCSAGVGRTGCFIALDTMLQHIEEHDFIDVFGLASEMRQHRNHMIQTEAQYVFVHKAMLEFIDTHYTGKSPTRFSTFPSLYSNPFAEDSTQMTDYYYGDFLSEETPM